MEPIWLAIIVAVGALFSSVLTSSLNAWQIRKGKEQDYARQDAVADHLEKRQDEIQIQAEEKARLLEEHQQKAEEATQILIESNKLVATQAFESTQITYGKLDQIHELVNSSLTSQMEEAHTALAQQLVLMREVIALNAAAGRAASKEALETIKIIELKVAELASKLSDRAKATEIADKKVVV